MLVADGEVDVSLAIAGGIQSTLYQVFLHRRAWSLGIAVEQQESLRQLTVVQAFGLQHVGSHGLVVTGSYQFLDTLALVLLTGCV